MDDFELFSKSHARTSGQQPTLTFQKGGRAFALNRAAVEKIGSEFVQLFYSKSRRALGIKAAKETDTGAIQIRSVSNSATSLIAAKAFTTTYGLEFTEAIRANLLAENDMLIAEVPKEATEHLLQRES
jgi:hypothetical protein